METMRSVRSPKKEGKETRLRIETDESAPNMSSEESVQFDEHDMPQFSPFHLRADQIVIPVRPASPEVEVKIIEK